MVSKAFIARNMPSFSIQRLDKTKEVSIDCINWSDYPQMQRIIQKIKDEMPSVSFHVDQKRLEGLRMKESKPFATCTCYYNLKENVLYYSNPDDIDSALLAALITHEQDGVIHQGFFYQEPYSFFRGMGLTTIYQSVLQRRILGEKERISVAAEFGSRLVDILERVVGKEYMENLFFEGELASFTHMLEYYASEGKIMAFLRATDRVVEEKVWNMNTPKGRMSYAYIICFLEEVATNAADLRNRDIPQNGIEAFMPYQAKKYIEPMKKAYKKA